MSCGYSRRHYYSHPFPTPSARREHNVLQGNVIVGPAPWPGARCTVQMELAAPRLRCLEGERDGGGEAGLVLAGTGRALREGDRAGATGDGDSDRERRGEAAQG